VLLCSSPVLLLNRLEQMLTTLLLRGVHEDLGKWTFFSLRRRNSNSRRRLRAAFSACSEVAGDLLTIMVLTNILIRQHSRPLGLARIGVPDATEDLVVEEENDVGNEIAAGHGLVAVGGVAGTGLRSVSRLASWQGLFQSRDPG
jgi:hypothetical protein